MNQLEALRQYTTVVADTGDFELLTQFAPQDATTNPSLVLQAIRDAKYKPLFEQVVDAARGASVERIADRVVVAFGKEILQRIPGRVSSEVDARLSFDTEGSIRKAKEILALYQAQGVNTSRVLIKLASTWEGIQAAKALENEGIHTNLTLLFSLPQAIACANAKVQLISPFVGRIYDWYKKSAGTGWDELAHAGANDPGVRSVSQIFACYKANGIATEIMGASFRNVGQICALAGCDLLTISPKLLAELQASEGPVSRALGTAVTDAAVPPYHQISEQQFRLDLNRDAMATEKLAEGIRQFEADAIALERMILDRIQS
ncbi:transaldolase [Rhodoferax sp. GW822-FHT02A01]|uniref:transaldolase n=1 Tax=Rhodoferax sp. GW822-FHT02A01 TaxID=3141537 RepID=UPI00315DB47E